MASPDGVDRRIEKWGAKIAESRGNRKTFYVQLDWFQDFELIRTIAELKDRGMFTQFIRVALRTIAPLLLYGDTNGVLDVGDSVVSREENLDEASETRLLREIRGLADAVSYGVSRMKSESGGQTQEAASGTAMTDVTNILEEMYYRQEELMGEITRVSDLVQQSGSKRPSGTSRGVSDEDDFVFDADALAGAGEDFSYEDVDADEFSLDNLRVDEDDSDESASRRMLTSFFQSFGNGE